MNLGNLGSFGENYTARYLYSRGYKIVQTNYHSRFGEIDIIAVNETYIAFVEVKARTNDFLYAPVFAVTKAKQKKIITTALMYLQKNKTALQPRFDVAEMVVSQRNQSTQIGNKSIEKFNYIENAFMAGGNNRYF